MVIFPPQRSHANPPTHLFRNPDSPSPSTSHRLRHAQMDPTDRTSFPSRICRFLRPNRSGRDLLFVYQSRVSAQD